MRLAGLALTERKWSYSPRYGDGDDGGDSGSDADDGDGDGADSDADGGADDGTDAAGNGEAMLWFMIVVLMVGDGKGSCSVMVMVL